LKGKIIILF